jgi:hypothetical protein
MIREIPRPPLGVVAVVGLIVLLICLALVWAAW